MRQGPANRSLGGRRVLVNQVGKDFWQQRYCRAGLGAHLAVGTAPGQELAETVRFELTDGCPSAVFKTAGLNHSPKSPGGKPHILAARQRRRVLHAVGFPYGRCARDKATRLHMPSDLSSSSVSLEGTGGRGTSASASARVCAISASGSGVSCGSKSYSLTNSVRSMASSR